MSTGSRVGRGLLVSAGAVGLTLALWVGASTHAQAKTAAPKLRVAVTPSDVVIGTQAELLAQLVPAKAVKGPRVVATVRLPSGATKPVKLLAVPNQAGLWEGMAPAATIGKYEVSWTLTGTGGSPVLTNLSHYTVVKGSAFDRSGRLIGFVVIIGAAWFLFRRRRYSR